MARSWTRRVIYSGNEALYGRSSSGTRIPEPRQEQDSYQSFSCVLLIARGRASHAALVGIGHGAGIGAQIGPCRCS